jgi:ABC-type dipeptide/oligopeptide/nickel transport system permease subunit
VALANDKDGVAPGQGNPAGSASLVALEEEDAPEQVLQPLEAAADAELAGEADDKPASQWRLFSRRFLRHKLAIASAIVLLLLYGGAIFAPQVATHDPIAQDLTNMRQGPTAAHWFGTDDLGRDQFSRVVYAGRISLKIGLAVAIMSTLFGTAGGAAAGYFGRQQISC